MHTTRKHMKSIKSKIMVYVLPFTLIAIIGIIVMFYIFAKGTIVENTYEELDANAHRYSNQIQTWFAEKQGAMNAVAKALETKDNGEVLEYLKLASELFVIDGATELYMGTEDGNFYDASGWIPDADYIPKQRPWYIQASKADKTIFTEPYFDVDSQGIVLSAAAKIMNFGSTLKGVVSTDLTVDSITEYVKEIKVGETGFVFAIDNHTGMVVLHSEPEAIGKNIEEVFPGLNEIVKEANNGVNIRESYKMESEEYWVSHSEIKSVDWTFFIAISEKEAMEPVQRLMYIVFVLLIGTIVLLTFVLAYSISKITNPIKVLLKEIAQIGSGDFSNPISNKLILQKDEIGTFAKTVEKMRVDIRGIIESIIETSTINNENITNIFDKIDKLNIYIKEVSRTTQDLSANVEEMAASTEETSRNAGVIEDTVGEIAKKSYESLDNMEIIKNRASNVMTHSKESQERASKTREEVEVKLHDAIEQSKAIERITVLSNTIMQITAQTNLLALNAAIEAARAGEYGKGFAVVADEISQLSDNSQEAVLQIQDVIVLLQNAVGELVKSSQVMLEFFENHVIGDYEGMVKIGEQYYNDSDEVSGVFKDFNGNTDELNKSIKIMTNVLSEISLTSQVSAKENQAIAEKAVLLLNNSNDIIEIVKDTKEKSMLLIKMVDKFRI